MFDVLSNTDLWNKVLTLLVGVVTLITAVITLRKSRAEKAQVAQDSPLKLRTFRASEASPIWSRLLNVFIVTVVILSFVMLIAAGVALYVERSLQAALSFAFFGACAYANIYIFLMRRRGRISTITREATLNVQGNYDQVLENCIAALRKMKVRLTAIDSKDGTVEGKTRLNWRSFGEIILIRITEAGPGEYAVHVGAPTPLPAGSMDGSDGLGRPSVAGAYRYLGMAGYSASALDLFRAHNVSSTRAFAKTEFGRCRACTRGNDNGPCRLGVRCDCVSDLLSHIYAARCRPRPGRSRTLLRHCSASRCHLPRLAGQCRFTSWCTRGNGDYWIIAFRNHECPSPAGGTLVGAVNSNAVALSRCSFEVLGICSPSFCQTPRRHRLQPPPGFLCSASGTVPSGSPDFSLASILARSSGSGFRSRACDHWNRASSSRPTRQ
jgi:uncharacterized membrane protein YfcA